MSDIQDELLDLRRECGYNGYDEFSDDEDFKEEWGDGDSVDGLIAYKDALEDRIGAMWKSTFDALPLQDDRVIYEPYLDNGVVGLKCTHAESGDVEYLYFNPSDNPDYSDTPNVFIYQGTEGDPSKDGAYTHYTVLEEHFGR